MQARIENIMDCSCRADTCTCCGGCNCKHGAATTAKTAIMPNFGVDLAKLNTGIDGVKEIAVNLGKLGTSIDGFPKRFSAEVGLAKEVGITTGVSGASLGLLLGLVLGLIFARR